MFVRHHDAKVCHAATGSVWCARRPLFAYSAAMFRPQGVARIAEAHPPVRGNYRHPFDARMASQPSRLRTRTNRDAQLPATMRVNKRKGRAAAFQADERGVRLS